MQFKEFKKTLFITLSFLAVAQLSLAQIATHQPLNKALKDSLKNEIETMIASDQEYRWMIQFGELDGQKIAELKKQDINVQLQRMQDVHDKKAGLSPAQYDSLWTLQSCIDSVNFIKMSGIVYKYGYPKKYVEPDKVSTIFLHASITAMNSDFFKVLKQEVEDGNMTGMDYAIIYDKIQIGNKLPELYYVIEHFDPKTNTSAIGKVKDIETTNKAREEIGLKRIKSQS